MPSQHPTSSNHLYELHHAPIYKSQLPKYRAKGFLPNIFFPDVIDLSREPDSSLMKFWFTCPHLSTILYPRMKPLRPKGTCSVQRRRQRCRQLINRLVPTMLSARHRISPSQLEIQRRWSLGVAHVNLVCIRNTQDPTVSGIEPPDLTLHTVSWEVRVRSKRTLSEIAIVETANAVL